MSGAVPLPGHPLLDVPAAIALIDDLWQFGLILLALGLAARKLWERRPRWFGRVAARRSVLKRLARVRAVAAGSRALVLQLGQRIGFLVFLGGLALLNETFLSADRTRAMRDGLVTRDLLASIVAVHLIQLLLATSIMLIAVDAVDQLRAWAEPDGRRRAILRRYCRAYRPRRPA